ncbi:hypothetical protein [Aquisphaera insulae]|uniref:hypothetical protein n=1 Tax=Aquisphaera insulae TaxID=2712864 RepID=UPI00202E5592|nr:hypothetical protein [Aquisphaera insulae]
MRPIAFLALAVAAFAPGREASAQRQYYETTYTYSPTHQYYYVRYYYRPVVTTEEYSYHYCIYYPSHPRYIYYYNPTRQVYWGRYEIGSGGEKRYSILAEKDRKKDLKDIPEDAFPKPAGMPDIPESKDKVAIEPPPENVPKDAKDAGKKE